ncbi:hypothetical protein BGZ65_001782 [Modicella reniformis]|uniref:Uncharacterized protein n=1 Tax=Modicella reniformis TaxID=1440133 RepID=A0A9P6MJ64_9FUNG|nr:hypothetical protein BGZ65_001782 [Modicella reniformis]
MALEILAASGWGTNVRQLKFITQSLAKYNNNFGSRVTVDLLKEVLEDNPPSSSASHKITISAKMTLYGVSRQVRRYPESIHSVLPHLLTHSDANTAAFRTISSISLWGVECTSAYLQLLLTPSPSLEQLHLVGIRTYNNDESIPNLPTITATTDATATTTSVCVPKKAAALESLRVTVDGEDSSTDYQESTPVHKLALGEQGFEQLKDFELNHSTSPLSETTELWGTWLSSGFHTAHDSELQKAKHLEAEARALFARLAQLTNLRKLAICRGENNPGVDLSLKTGLDLLAPLEQLEELDVRQSTKEDSLWLDDEVVCRISVNMEVEDAMWIADHWRALRIVRGIWVVPEGIQVLKRLLTAQRRVVSMDD